MPESGIDPNLRLAWKNAGGSGFIRTEKGGLRPLLANPKTDDAPLPPRVAEAVERSVDLNPAGRCVTSWWLNMAWNSGV